ncbi:MAG: lysophospholipid acyltransferase family protein [Actinomycetota bacterium]
MAKRPPDVDTVLACHPLARAARELILGLALGPLIERYTHPKVLGVHHLTDLDHPVLFVANHSSHIDTPLLLRALPDRWRSRTVVMAAADYFYKSHLKALAVTLAVGTVPVERRGLDKRSADRMNWLLRERWNILVYPEGTRSRDGRLGTFRSGAAYLAVAHRLPVVPIYLHGTYLAMPRGVRWPRPHPVEVHIGAPIRPEPGEDHRGLTERIQSALARMRDEVGPGG